MFENNLSKKSYRAEGVKDTKVIQQYPSSFAKNTDTFVHYAKNGQRFGYIEMGSLTDFWIHTGTRCNLHCPFCFEGSHNTSNRLEPISYAEAQTLIYEALELGAKKISFTGGEPFVNKDFIKILDFALQYRPCLVLTNATAPMEKYISQLEELSLKPHALQLRVSIDFPQEKLHDAGRGAGMFRRSLQNCAKLAHMGHTVSIARHQADQEDEAAVTDAYRKIFAAFHLPLNTSIVAFPNLNTSTSVDCSKKTPEITEHCMATYKTKAQRENFMCCHCLMVAKKSGKVCVYPCTLVNDDDSYVLGHSLHEARQNDKIILKHQRCFTCFAYGTSCVEQSL